MEDSDLIAVETLLFLQHLQFQTLAAEVIFQIAEQLLKLKLCILLCKELQLYPFFSFAGQFNRLFQFHLHLLISSIVSDQCRQLLTGRVFPEVDLTDGDLGVGPQLGL
ncbi:hypothetical protein D3C81_1589430 [compost metagenome]